MGKSVVSRSARRGTAVPRVDLSSIVGQPSAWCSRSGTVRRRAQPIQVYSSCRPARFAWSLHPRLGCIKGADAGILRVVQGDAVGKQNVYVKFARWGEKAIGGAGGPSRSRGRNENRCRLATVRSNGFSLSCFTVFDIRVHGGTKQDEEDAESAAARSARLSAKSRSLAKIALRSDDISKTPHAQEGLYDASHGRTDHMSDWACDLDAEKASYTDQESKYPSDGRSNHERL